MLRSCLLCCVACAWAHLATGQAPAQPIKKQYNTQHVDNESIKLDGVLDDAGWNQVAWGGDFIENRPDENTPPAQPTQFRIVYDDKYLYVGYRCFDSAPDSIISRMSRRDEFPGDWMEINIDSYHDLRTAFSFTVSSSGVRGDEFVSNNGNNWDASWNPVWDAKARVDSLGWTAEIKIPFSQLRYGNQVEPVWGIEVTRLCFRKQERSLYQFISQSAGGWVSNFAELHGLRNLPSSRQIELAPYLVAKTERFKAEPGNPFADGSLHKVSVGIDGKVGVTRDLILDFTINPDFGQVEADPGAIRLDGYEVFFQEQRPFFIESRNLFDYQLTGSEAGGQYDSDQLFYSRRIGGAPHGYPFLKPGEYAKVPQKTAILGAAKFSGKTQQGWSVGILETVTRREHATIDDLGQRREELIEPLTNFFVGRLLKDFKEGNTVIGGVFTAVNRTKEMPALHRSAYSGGIDFQHYWKNRWWYIRGNALFSRVEGTKATILQTQTGFVHLFQRNNARHLEVDPNRTSLTGTGGTFRIGKIGGTPAGNGGIVKFESGVTWRSPELELNDAGFLQSADEINHFTWAGYQIQKPFGIFNNGRINYNHWARWDFSGRHLLTAFNTNIHGWFKNNWSVGTGFNYVPFEVSNNALRGGSSLRQPSGISNWVYVETDARKKISFNLNPYYGQSFGQVAHAFELYGGITLQPINALKVSISPGFSRSWRQQDQYVAQIPFGSAQRTIVSGVVQSSVSLTTRISYSLSPTLTIQFYGQPFLFRAKYDHYGIVTNPLDKDFDQRFHRFTAAEINTDNGNDFLVDEDRDGVTDYGFRKPDFNFVQFRGNLVLRWEYIPGSEIFLVWTQSNTPNANGDLDSRVIHSLFSNAFNEKPYNIFLLKATYRFLR